VVIRGHVGGGRVEQPLRHHVLFRVARRVEQDVRAGQTGGSAGQRMQLAPAVVDRLGRVGRGKHGVQRAIGMDVADLATGDPTVGGDGCAGRDECCVVVLLEVAAADDQGGAATNDATLRAGVNRWSGN